MWRKALIAMRKQDGGTMKNTLLCVLVFGILGTVSNANDEVLRQDPINIDGYVKADAEVTDRELEMINNELTKQTTTIQLNKSKTKKYKKLQDTTEKLANETEEYLAEKKSSQEAIDKYNKKIDCLMNNTRSADCDKILNRKPEVVDTVSTQAAATEKVETVAKTKADDSDSVVHTMKITPYSGINSYAIDDGNLESNAIFGMKAETEINSRFSAGAYGQYTTMTSRNFDSRLAPTYSGFGFYSSGYMDVAYTQYDIGAYGKFYVLNQSKFKPYVLGGLSYTRLNVESQNSTYNSNSNVNANYALGKIALGADFDFTKSFGINIEAAYTNPVFKREVSVNDFTLNYGEQALLTEQANKLMNTNIMSFNVGFNILF